MRFNLTTGPLQMESSFAGTIRSVFVFLVGALPAALITTYVILVGILSFGAFLGAPNMLLLFILPVILGIAASLGTVALCAAVFQQTNGLMALGLVVGVLAMAIVMPDDAFYFMFLSDWARRMLSSAL